MEITDLEKALKLLKKFWNEQNIISNPNSIDEILNFEFSKCLQLPEDFRGLYLESNGMLDLFPNSFDGEGFLFYPLQDLSTFEEEFECSKDDFGNKYIIFAEYMHKSWWYAVRFSDPPNGYEIGIIPSPNKFKVVTSDLSDFIRLYVENSPILYDYE